AQAKAGQIAVRFGDAPIEAGDLLEQLAQLALAGENAGLAVKGAHRDRAVRFQQLSSQGDEAKAGDVSGEIAGRGQVADDERPAQKLRGKVRQLGMFAGDKLYGMGNQARILRRWRSGASLSHLAKK